MYWGDLIRKCGSEIIFSLISFTCIAQIKEYSRIAAGEIFFNSVGKIDSIARSEAAGRYFCQAYSQSMRNISSEMEDLDSNGKLFIKGFESRFADYFVRAWIDNNNGNLSSKSEWKCFFTANAQPWQSILLGVNAHININMWQSLVDNFSLEEIRHHKKSFLRMQPGVTKVYHSLFDTLLVKSSSLRFFNSLTIGFPKKLGEHFVYKWRRRNVNLAILYFENQKKFKRRLRLVTRKKQRIDKKILSYNSEIT